MIKDSRGRVRFGNDGKRFELTNVGLNIYDRTVEQFDFWGHRHKAAEFSLGASSYAWALQKLVSTPKGRHTLELALRASRKKSPAKPRQFTNAIHIPPHMRAVPVNNQTRTK